MNRGNTELKLPPFNYFYGNYISGFVTGYGTFSVTT